MSSAETGDNLSHCGSCKYCNVKCKNKVLHEPEVSLYNKLLYTAPLIRYTILALYKFICMYV